ncbi:hypothetical protein [Chitinimonas sp. JJ19]|uniref:hypothetical protein n=1 Tax=Chitinimonas sp. JJ19 TaxID=3109352 RepID=UPI0030018172
MQRPTPLSCSLPALAILLLALPAQAEEATWSISTGIRVWSNEWEANSFPYASYLPGNGSQPQRQVVAKMRSDAEIVPIPTLSLRYGNWILNGSAAMEREFRFNDNLSTLYASRREQDINLGYFFAPQFNVGVGYKRLLWDAVNIDGPTLSVSGAAPLDTHLALYGGAAIGALKTRTSSLPGSLSTRYFVSEVGLTYNLAGISPRLSSVSGLFGYRMQKLTVHRFPLADSAGGRYTSSISDFTSGPVTGLTLRF